MRRVLWSVGQAFGWLVGALFVSFAWLLMVLPWSVEVFLGDTKLGFWRWYRAFLKDLRRDEQK